MSLDEENQRLRDSCNRADRHVSFLFILVCVLLGMNIILVLVWFNAA